MTHQAQVDAVETYGEHQRRMRAIAYRMLGSVSDAEDAVQEAMLRALQADGEDVRDLGSWLATITARVCLNMLRARRTRAESELHAESMPAADSGGGPEQQVLRGDEAGLAMLAVLTTLAPAERVAFVLHDMFDVSFAEIAPIVERSEQAARQLASRARRRLREAAPRLGHSDLAQHRRTVDTFLDAARDGRLADLVAMLAPDAVLTSDARAANMGAPARLDGAAAVAGRFSGGAQVVRPALLGAGVGAVWEAKGRPVVAFTFTFQGDEIVAVHMVAERVRLIELDPVTIDT